jgi:hypothetical protein
MAEQSDSVLEEVENPETFEKILEKLKQLNITYVHTHHKPVKTSQEAAVLYSEFRSINSEGYTRISHF